MYSINTFWSANNMIAERKLQEAIDQQIQHDRKSKRYRRLGYYFFEKEIQSDIRKKLESNFMSSHHLLVDPEYQACIARSSLGKTVDAWTVWDEATFVLNNYLFNQDVFVWTDSENDHRLVDILLWLLSTRDNPGFLNDSLCWMSDVLLQCRRTRADIVLIQSICNGEHTYKSLVKSVWEYIGQYAMLPRFFHDLELSRSSEAVVSLLEETTQDKLSAFLQPMYEIHCHLLNVADVQSYGYVDTMTMPYTTWISRLWLLWWTTPWYVKIILSIAIVLISGWFGWVSLIVLPLVRWIFAVARSSSQYVTLLRHVLTQRYVRYQDHHTSYMNLYDTMIDPDQTTKDSIKAQQTMTRRYDIVPFSGHDLMWDATQYAKILFEALMTGLSSWYDDTLKDIAMISSVYDRWKEHHLSLMIVKDGQYTEQVSYRFESLLLVLRDVVWPVSSHSQYIETYDIIDELVSTKQYNFRFWTYRDAIIDGATVAVSSGVLWWMWSYLRNRSVAGSSTFAASPAMVADTLSQSDSSVLFDADLLSAMKGVMRPEDMDRFVDVMSHGQHSATLWDTMVSLFGEKQWNIYTNNLMDARWRVGQAWWESTLFDAALRHGLPTSSQEAWWTSLMHFLHRVYGYDNLQEYETLIDKSWLSNTLSGLKDGSISIEQFAQIDVKQREIITQAMFYTLPKEELAWLFVQAKTEQTIDMSESLSLGQKILDILWWKNDIVTTGVVDTWSLVSPDYTHTWSLVESGDIVFSGATQTNTGRWRQQFTWFTSLSHTTWSAMTWTISDMTWSVSVDTGAISSWWIDRLSSRWHNLTHPTYTITDTWTNLHIDTIHTGYQSVNTGSLTQSGAVIDSGSVSTGQVGWFDRFFTWLKGTPPPKTWSVDLSGLVNTGQIEHVLSGINPTDLQEQATGFAEQLAHQSWWLEISKFTLPVLRKDKKVE